MVSAIISRLVILIFGTLYPAYASYKAVKTKNVKEYVKWMMYWIVFALFTCVETIADIFVAWLPFYYELKILFVLWLLSPATKGSSILYRKFVHPQLAKREKEIDAYLNKASDQGYSAILSLGSRGLNYASNIVLTTALKGQSTITDHLRKSYSLNDLSGDDPDGQFRREDSIQYDEDEEERVVQRQPISTDNRLIEESFQQEMEEKSIEGEETKVRKRRSKSKDAGLNIVEEEPSDDLNTEKREKSTKVTYSHKEELSASLAGVYSQSKPAPLADTPTTLPGYTPFRQYSRSPGQDQGAAPASSWRHRSTYSSYTSNK